MATFIDAPQPGEYKPYAIAYVSLVPEGGRLVEYLQDGAATTEAMTHAYPPERLTTPHAPGEWTVQDVLQHVIDDERVFAYRLLCIARGDKSDFPGFEQDDYAATANANARTLGDLLDEYRSVRAASISLVRSLRDDVLTTTGTADGHPLSVRAAVYLIAGHELYHLNSLRENYGDFTAHD